MKQNLKYYCRKIDLIIVFPKGSTNQYELIITTKGNAKLFKQVIDLVDNAPQLKDWKFNGFITSKETIEKRLKKLDNPFIIQDINIKEDQVQFFSINLMQYGKKRPFMFILKIILFAAVTKQFIRQY
jgi:hypothetical protein